MIGRNSCNSYTMIIVQGNKATGCVAQKDEFISSHLRVLRFSFAFTLAMSSVDCNSMAKLPSETLRSVLEHLSLDQVQFLVHVLSFATTCHRFLFLTKTLLEEMITWRQSRLQKFQSKHQGCPIDPVRRRPRGLQPRLCCGPKGKPKWALCLAIFYH